MAGDIASPGVADRLVAAAEETGLPLRGVVHSAAVIDDGLVATLSRESLDRVWAPKAAARCGCTKPPPADSSTGGLAFPLWLLCWARPGRRRTRARMRGSTPWSHGDGHRVCLPSRSTGASGRRSESPARLTFGVLDPISPAEGIEALESLVGSNLARVGVARLRLDRAAAAFPEIHDLGYFATMVEELDALSVGG